MKKKQLKLYDAPIVEVVELETSISLLAGSPLTPGDDNDEIEM